MAVCHLGAGACGRGGGGGGGRGGGGGGGGGGGRLWWGWCGSCHYGMAIAIAMTSSIIATGLLAVLALLDVLLLPTPHCLKQCCPTVQDVDDPLQQWELEDTRCA